MARRKISHARRVLNTRSINKNNLLKGMIINFTYTKPDVYDRKPLILVLNRENNLLDGLNFNYLHENKIQEMFKSTFKAFGNNYDETFKDESFFNLKGEFTRIGLNEGIAPSEMNSQEFYNTVVKPLLLTHAGTKDCYRTYDLNKVSSIKIIDYRIDILEKYKLKSSEFTQRFIELGGKLNRNGNPISKGRNNRLIYEKTKKEFGV